MARGIVYEIETDRDNVGFLDESDLYDLAGYGADYFQNIENETPILQKFLKRWKDYGAYTGTVTNYEGKSIPWIVFTRDAREAYFKAKFVTMQKLAATMTFDQFCSDVTNLKRAVCDTYDDAVYFNKYFQPMDDFLRTLILGKRYYIGHAVFMH